MLSYSSDFVMVLAALFSSAWKIVVSFKIPGTNMNVAEFFFAGAMIIFVLKAVPKILGFSSWSDGNSDGK